MHSMSYKLTFELIIHLLYASAITAAKGSAAMSAHYSDGFLNQILDLGIVREVSADVFKPQQYLTNAITV